MKASTVRSLPTAPLEEWMRRFYFEVEIDIGSSGVEDYSFGQLREILGFTSAELDAVWFHDSRTLGGPGVRRAIAERFAGGDVERAIVTHGATEANFLVMHALLEPGDEVVAIDPLYQQLYAIAETIGCRIERVPLAFDAGFALDMERLSAVTGSRTKMIVVNFPHNPTGTTVTVEEQREIVNLAKKSGAYLVWDNAFADLTYEEPPLPEVANLYERAVSMGTLSKAYGLPGLRVGWCIAQPSLLERFVRMRDYTTLHLSPLVEFLAERAIANPDLLIQPRLAQAAANRARLRAWAYELGELIELFPARGGVCAFPRLSRIADVEGFCAHLCEVDRVLLVPGGCFGAPRHVRLGFGGSETDFEEGLGRLASALRRETREFRAQSALVGSGEPTLHDMRG